MTAKRFLEWLESLQGSIPECTLNFEYSLQRQAFLVTVSYEAGGLIKSLNLAYPLDKLNDTKHTQTMMDEFVPNIQKAIEKDRLRSHSLGLN